MFVIVQCLDNLRSKREHDTWTREQKIGHALRHAGVSITVTSATDVVVFAVGAVTVSNQIKYIFFKPYYFVPNFSKCLDCSPSACAPPSP